MAEIYELGGERRAIARPVFSEATFDRTFVDAYFEGRQAGRLFVDSPTAPQSAMLCRTYEFFLAGSVTDSLRQFVRDAPAEASVFDVVHDLDAARRTQTIAFYGFVPISNAWKETLLADFADRIETIGRRSFRYPVELAALAGAWRSRVPLGYEVRYLDAALAERVDRELGDVLGLMWGGYESFANGGFGACAMAGDVIVGVAYTGSVSDRELNISVETAPAHRRRGLASIVSLAVIDEGHRQGLAATWDCDLENVASAALATSIGFVESTPFVELAFPGRSGPVMSSGVWRAVEEEGFTRWVRE